MQREAADQETTSYYKNFHLQYIFQNTAATFTKEKLIMESKHNSIKQISWMLKVLA